MFFLLPGLQANHSYNNSTLKLVTTNFTYLAKKDLILKVPT